MSSFYDIRFYDNARVIQLKYSNFTHTESLIVYINNIFITGK